MIIVTLKEAIAKNLPRYFTGKPCRRNHTSERYTSSKGCIACSKFTCKQWNESNKEYHREYQQNLRAKDPEAHRNKMRESSRENYKTARGRANQAKANKKCYEKKKRLKNAKI